jgi:hypothetical protein
MNVLKRLPDITGALLLAAFSTSQSTEWANQVRLATDSKRSGSDDWSHCDEQGSRVLLLDFRQQDWPTSIFVDLYGTGDEEQTCINTYDGCTLEAYISVRNYFFGSSDARRWIHQMRGLNRFKPDRVLSLSAH